MSLIDFFGCAEYLMIICYLVRVCWLKNICFCLTVGVVGVIMGLQLLVFILCNWTLCYTWFIMILFSKLLELRWSIFGRIYAQNNFFFIRHFDPCNLASTETFDLIRLFSFYISTSFLPFIYQSKDRLIH